MTGGKFIMAAFAGQQGPCTSDPPAIVRATVIPLAEAIVIVSVPAGPQRCLHFEYRIHHTKGVPNNRIMRVTNSVTDKFEESRVNDRVGRKFKRIARTPVREN